MLFGVLLTCWKALLVHYGYCVQTKINTDRWHDGI